MALLVGGAACWKRTGFSMPVGRELDGSIVALLVRRELDGWMVALLVGSELDGWMVALLVGRELGGSMPAGRELDGCCIVALLVGRELDGAAGWKRAGRNYYNRTQQYIVSSVYTVKYTRSNGN